LVEHTEKGDLLILVQYDFSTNIRSKQQLMSINDYYMNRLELITINFANYFQLADSGIEIDSVENALGLIPSQDEFWLSYHHTRMTDYISRFQDQVNQNFAICNTYEYGEQSTLIHYVIDNSNEKSCNN